MNVRDLSYIRAVAKHGHFGRAATACNVSQPTLSGQIKKLELELDVILFERNNRSVQLTAIGAEIVKLADDALESIESIRVIADAASDPLSGQFSLGAIPTIAPYLISHILRQTADGLPNLNFGFREDITERLTADLLGGEIDAAILATEPESAKLDAIPLFDEPFWVIFPQGHDLARRKNIRMHHLPVSEILLLSEGHCFRDQAVDICQISTAPDSQNVRATSLETLTNLVMSGRGITLVPALALENRLRKNSGVDTRRLKDPAAYRRTYLTFRKTFPRRDLLERIAEVLRTGLPESVSLV